MAEREGLIKTALGCFDPDGLRADALVESCCATYRPSDRVRLPLSWSDPEIFFKGIAANNDTDI